MKLIFPIVIAVLCVFDPCLFAQQLNSTWAKPTPQYQSPSFCPQEGQGGDEILNRAKNRIDVPSFYHGVSFSSIKNLHSADAAAEKDRDVLTAQQTAEISKYEGIPVRVTGYIKFGRIDTIVNPDFVGVEKKGAEACNCGSTQADEVDYHITIVKNRGDEFRDAIVVEMSPRVRASHPAWSLANLRAYARNETQVRVFGWLMFDGEHKELMYDPDKPDKPRVRRASLWEIHPITRFEVKIDGVWMIL